MSERAVGKAKAAVGAGSKVEVAASNKGVAKPVPPQSTGLLAVVRIRSAVDATTEVHDTLRFLRLQRKNACAVVKDSPSARGMMKRVGPYVAWGAVSQAVVDKLKSRTLADGIFALQSPRGGFARKGIKLPFGKGGAAGHRALMDDLLERMI